jgi:hypothetical protein
MRKNCTFLNILQKLKSYILPISIILRLIPIEIPKKYKIEAPHYKLATNLATHPPKLCIPL